ncbi:MAG: redoxin domain-containing protein [Saprospiraceae bacterium]|nr:redoxin domain-containing protein [Saprospiraceae bacterium]
MTLNVGDIAPEFNLYDSDKNKVSLSESKGQTRLLLFFPLAFTSVCTDELCGVRDDIGFYRDHNVHVMAISVDSLFTLAKFKEEIKIDFPLISDFNKETSLNYDSLHQSFAYEMKGVSKRSVYIIDKIGTIRYVEILENPSEVPNFEAIKEVIASLK